MAVNTISLVKNEAIFTYLAPSNLLAWILHPLRYFMSFRKFVRLNRTVVKVTHFPLLAAIYLYERSLLRSPPYNTLEIPRTKSQHITIDAMKPPRDPNEIRSPAIHRLRRRDSINSSHQDRALDQVFATPIKSADMSDMVDSWVDNMLSSSPLMDESGLAFRHHQRPRGSRPRHYSPRPTQRFLRREFSHTRSALSDPEEFASGGFGEPFSEAVHTEDEDADNEANIEDNTDDEEEEETNAESMYGSSLMPPNANRLSSLSGSSSLPLTRDTLAALHPTHNPHRSRPKIHERIGSTNTVLFNPVNRTKAGLPATPTPAPRRGGKSSSPRKGKEPAPTEPRAIDTEEELG